MKNLTNIEKEFNGKIYNLINNNTVLKGKFIDKNLVTCTMIASFEDIETGEFTEPELILDIKNGLYNESELTDFFEKNENEEFEVHIQNPATGDYIVTFFCPDAVYSLKIQIFYL